MDTLHFAPCLPADWKAFTLHYRYRETVYHIVVTQTDTLNTAMHVTVDGVEQPGMSFPLRDDQAEHVIEAWIVPPAP